MDPTSNENRSLVQFLETSRRYFATTLEARAEAYALSAVTGHGRTENPLRHAAERPGGRLFRIGAPPRLARRQRPG